VLTHAQSIEATPEVLIQSPVTSTLAASPVVTRPTIAPVKTGSLETAVGEALEGSKGKYSVVIKNLTTGESYRKEEHEVYESGSLYKLWVMATAYDQIEQGTLTEDEVLSASIATLNDKFHIATPDAELTEGGISLSTREALNQMITISHNYAAMLLSQKVRLSSVSRYLQDNGLSESKIGTAGNAPTVTAWDAALFMEKLYREQLAQGEHTQDMLDLLKGQKLNNKIPKYLPANVFVAHKTGEINQFSHDAGIVYSSAGTYIIAILSESDNPPGSEERIARISEAVYQYFIR
jgi:beta-lactamase class A